MRRAVSGDSQLERTTLTRKASFNPFYPLVVAVGIVFVLTVLAYVAAWVRLQQPGPSDAVELGPVLTFVNDRWDWLMIVETALLALLAVLAMGLDQWRTRQTGK